MTTLLPRLPDIRWDVVQDGDGFSAEASIERILRPAEVPSFEAAVGPMAPVVRQAGEVQLRAIATVDEDSLWIYVNALGPAPYGDEVADRARALMADLWAAVHTAAARP